MKNNKRLNQKLGSLLENGDILGFKNAIKSYMNEELENSFTDLVDVEPLPAVEPEPEENISDEPHDEADAVEMIRNSSVAAGGDEGQYEGGLLDLTIPSLEGAKQFAAALDACDHVESYEIEGISLDDSEKELSEPGAEDKQLSDVNPENFVGYDFNVYLNPDLVTEEPTALDDGDVVDDENGTIVEARKVIRLNFGSSKKKIKCNPGYRFDHTENRCVAVTKDEAHSRHKEIRLQRHIAKSISGVSRHPIVKKSAKNALARSHFGPPPHL